MLRTLTLLLLCAPAALAQQPPQDSLVVAVGGQVRVLHRADLATLPRSEVTTGYGGTAQIYRGVPLVAVLVRAGLDSSALHGEGLAQTLLVEAADGYRMAFGVDELDSVVTGRVLLLADSVDGQGLPAMEAPWRLIAGGDRHARRSVRAVAVLRVLPPPPPLLAATRSRR